MPIVHASAQPQPVDLHGLIVKALEYSRQTLDTTRVNLNSARVDLQETLALPKGNQRETRLVLFQVALDALIDLLHSELNGRDVLDGKEMPAA